MKIVVVGDIDTTKFCNKLSKLYKIDYISLNDITNRTCQDQKDIINNLNIFTKDFIINEVYEDNLRQAFNIIDKIIYINLGKDDENMNKLLMNYPRKLIYLKSKKDIKVFYKSVIKEVYG